MRRADAREVTVSGNRQVGHASEFARKLEVGPKSKLLEVLARVPDGGHAVLLMRRPKDYAAALSELLSGRRSARQSLRRLRAEWPE